MSTDDERPTTLAGGAQRALRAARSSSTPAVEESAAEPTADEPTAAEPTADTVRLTKPVAEAPAAPVKRTPTVVHDEPPVAPSGRTRTKPVSKPVSKPNTKPVTKPVTKRVTKPAARGTRSRFTAIAAGLAAVALVFAVVSAVVWWRAGHNDDRTTALARDDVAVSARLAIATVNTSDYRHPANALTNWLEVSTGTLRSQFSASRKSATQLIGQAKTLVTATVLDAAVTKLDAGRGSATVIASVNVKRKPVTGAATTTRNRFRATMTRVGGEWKLDDLKIVEAQLV